jgi:hypothetical protein
MPESFGHFPNHVEVLNFLKVRTLPLPFHSTLRPGIALGRPWLVESSTRARC